jgi:hypothetical protein
MAIAYPQAPANSPPQGPQGVGLRLPTVNYTGTIEVGIRRTSVPASLANQVIQFNSRRDTVTLQFQMDNNEYSEWYQWIRENGYWWFTMPIVSPYTPTLITSVHKIRFISELRYMKQGDNWLSIDVDAEIMMNDAE